jgi:hypothetical protein
LKKKIYDKHLLFIFSLSEICDTHQLLVDHRKTVTAGPGDPLHPLLEALGKSVS